MGRKNLEEQEGSLDQLPTINPTTNHFENENNGDDIGIERGKSEQKSNVNRISKKYNAHRSTL